MKRRDFVRTASGALLGAGSLATVRTPKLSKGEVPSKDGIARLDDFLIVDGSDVSVLTGEYLDWLEQAGVTAWTYNGLGKTGYGALAGLGFFDDALAFLHEHRDRISVAKSVREIRRAKENGRLVMVLGWQSADPFQDEPGQWRRRPPRPHIRSFHELGLRMCGIAYNLTNMFGGGCLDPHVGLTKAGRHLVDQLHAFGIIVDIGGHTAERTSLDIVEMAAGVPLVCSHANVAALVDNPRNVSDRLIEGIASTGGVVGITAINDFNARSAADAGVASTPQVGVEVMLDHIDYVESHISGVPIADHEKLVIG